MSSSSSRGSPLSDSSDSIRKRRNLPCRKSNVPHTKKRNNKKIEKIQRKAKNTKKKRNRCEPTTGITYFVSSVHPDCVLLDIEQKEDYAKKIVVFKDLDIWFRNIQHTESIISWDQYYQRDNFDENRVQELEKEKINYYRSVREIEDYYKELKNFYNI